jgi:hypothetical protein
MLIVAAGFLRGLHAEDTKHEVEITLMAIGDPSGGKLQANSTGCAVVHFMNRTKEAINLPTAPSSLGKGRVENWEDASYLSPKQGDGRGYGYRAAFDIPKVTIEFVDAAGTVVHRDSSIQLQSVGVIKAEVWGTSPILFSTPPNPGSYSVRFVFDNTMMDQSSGFNIVTSDPDAARLVTFKDKIDIPAIPIIKKQNKAEMATPRKPSD